MKQTGELLKTARENKNLSLHEIGMSLKINPKTLQAIEEGDTSKLPQRTFLRGFVKSYAQYLKIDVKHTMASFDQELNGNIPAPVPVTSAATTSATENLSQPKDSVEKAEPNVAAPTPQPIAPKEIKVAPVATIAPVKSIPKLSERAPNHIDRSKEAKTQRTLLLIGAILLCTIIVIVAKLVNKYQKERGTSHPKTEIARLDQIAGSDTSPTLVDSAGNPIAPTSTLPEGTAAAAPVTPANPAEAVTPVVSSPFMEKMTTPTLLPVESKTELHNKPATTAPPPAEKSVTPQPPKEAATKSKPTEKIEKAEAATEVDASSAGKPQEVIIEAKAKVSITYQLDDGKLQTLELNADEMHTFKSKNILKLEVSDGGAVDLIVNGRDKGSPGKAGAPVKLSYPK